MRISRANVAGLKNLEQAILNPKLGSRVTGGGAPRGRKSSSPPRGRYYGSRNVLADNRRRDAFEQAKNFITR